MKMRKFRLVRRSSVRTFAPFCLAKQNAEGYSEVYWGSCPSCRWHSRPVASRAEAKPVMIRTSFVLAVALILVGSWRATAQDDLGRILDRDKIAAQKLQADVTHALAQ